MKGLTDFETILEDYNNFIRAIKVNNISSINDCLNLINSYEILFLNNYGKRKNEGVYFTDNIIADFIVNEVLLLLINERLKVCKNSVKPLDHIKEIFTLDLETKEFILDLLVKATVCDPACGSGAFLLSYANIVYKLIGKLDFSSDENKLKLKILKNLHGFDINNYTIKLCILKLFAWIFRHDNSNNSEIISILEKNLKIENSLITALNSKYDIIIGNPPYGNILKKKEKLLLKEKNVFYNDIYCSFLTRALKWSKGIIGFLVPKSFLLRQGYVQFRNQFLSNANLLKIYDIGPNLFKTATNEVQIVLYEEKNSINKDLRIYDYPDKEIISYKNQVIDTLRICLNPKCPLSVNSKKFYVYTFKNECPYCGFQTVMLNRIRIKPSNQIYQLINKIERIGNLNYLNIRDFPKMIRGEEDKGLKKVRNLIKKDREGSCFFISAKEDLKYYHLNPKKSFDLEKIDSHVLKGKDYEYYTGPKLLIKHNNIIPEAVYTEAKYCFTSSIYSLLSEDKSTLKYLCAILNSALIQFYCIYGINNQKGTTINLNQYMIRHLPLLHPRDEMKMEIVNKVDFITQELKINGGNLSKEVKEVIKKIDDLIFNIYSINAQEKKMILPNVEEQINYFQNIYE